MRYINRLFTYLLHTWECNTAYCRPIPSLVRLGWLQPEGHLA